jgi:RNA polymerase sigma-70 factor (ECF subfamily)
MALYMVLRRIFYGNFFFLHPFDKFCFVNEKEFHHLTDQEILENYYATGNARLLGVLLQRYTLLLLGVCMKYLKNEEAAKDATQQVFLKVIGELRRYRVQYFKSWLYMIARNHCLMQLRNHAHKNARSLNEDMVIEDDSPLQYHTRKEKVLSLLESSLDELNAEQKTCVTLFYLEKRSYQQISEQTGFTMLQVKSHIQNGKRNLKLLVERKLKEK